MRTLVGSVRLILVVGIALALTGAVAGAPMAISVQGVGLQTPESILYDRASDVYLVSNINGNPTGTDGNGFISRIAPSGRVLALKWIDGTRSGVRLNAPKGMAIVGDRLYVSDITAVRIFNRRTGRQLGSIDIAGSTFLNDLAAGPDGSVYVTDSGLKPDFSPSGTDAVYRIDRMGKLATVAKSRELSTPNGVAVLPDGRLFIVTFTDVGEVYALAGSERRDVRRMPAGGLDGVELIPGGAMLISSWGGSAVFRLARDGQASVVVANVASPADIGYDSRRNRVLIPLFTRNRLVIQPLP
jgi:sugar lactone lactonase YvrE